MSDRWEVEPYSPLDKRILVNGPLPLIIDNDDVWTPGVAILLDRVIEVLNDNWVSVYVKTCQNEDCEAVGNIFHDTLTECFICHKPLFGKEVEL